MPSSSAYDNIMKSLANRKTGSIAMVVELERKLSVQKQQREQEQERADKLAQRIEGLITPNKALQAKNVDDTSILTRKYVTDSQKEQLRINQLEREVEYQGLELAAAETEAKEAKERNVRTWEELQDAEDTEMGKGKKEGGKCWRRRSREDVKGE